MRGHLPNWLARLTAGVAALSALFFATGTAEAGELEKIEKEFIEVIEAVRPSVAFIESEYEPVVPEVGALEEAEAHLGHLMEEVLKLATPMRGYFSGVVFTSDGHIVTVGNVLSTTVSGATRRAVRIEVTLHDGSTYVAEPVGVDDLTNIGVVKIDGAPGLVPVRFAQSPGVKVGSWVLAVGNAYGLVGSVSTGMVGGKDRVLRIGGRTLTDMIQFTAPVNPGDAGGLVANISGELVGLISSSCPRTRSFEDVSKSLVDLGNVFERDLSELGESGRTPKDLRKVVERLMERIHPKGEEDAPGGASVRIPELFLGGEGINFAVSGEVVKVVAEGLIKHGKVRRGFLGVSVSSVSEVLRDQLGLPGDVGAVIADVVEGGPADMGGIDRWDVVLEVNGQRVEGPVHLRRVVTSRDPASRVSFKVLRMGKVVEITVELGELGEEDDISGER